MAQIPCWSILFVFNLPVSSFTLSKEYSFNHTIMHSLVKRNFRLSLREVYLLRKAVYFQYSIVSPWSSLIVGDERLDRPKQKAVVFMLNPKNYATHAWHKDSKVVGLLGRFSCSYSVWPDWAKFFHFGNIQKALVNFLRVYLVFGEILKPLGQLFNVNGPIFTVVNGQMLNK